MVILPGVKERDFAILRRDAAPLRLEREEYLTHLLDQGSNPRHVRAVASRLVHVNRLLGLTQLRPVNIVEVRDATGEWLKHIEERQSRGIRPSSAYTFQNAAENWLRFHSMLIEFDSDIGIFNEVFNKFVKFTAGRQLSVDATRSLRTKLSVFLTWAGHRHSQVSEITLNDVDRFLEEKRRSGLKPRSAVSYCSALRTFFRYSADQGWSHPTIARGIKISSVSNYEELPLGPSWSDVRRMLNAPVVRTVAGLRRAAILSLCAMYALRGIEIRRIALIDFDWVNETVVIRRAKRGPIQRFPLLYEVGEAVLRYLRHGRPRCGTPEVFVTLKPPYRPMNQCVLAALVRSQMEALKIESKRYGTHALRHSCATQLLRKGSSLIEIADFLGHRSVQSVSIYAKLDKRRLRQVATFSLSGVL